MIPTPDSDLIPDTVAHAPCRHPRIVVMTHRHHCGLAVLFSTDLDLDPVTLYRYHVARFQIGFPYCSKY
ncbi:MAG: hypothetical protein RKP20_10340 [Candidatus Competibacter sp.]|nr:hypothetical protein [Candidatus Competibacter sp.]